MYNLILLKNKVYRLSSAAISIVTVVLLLIYNSILNVWGYLTNDDTSIQTTFSGLFTENPFPVHQFVHFLLGFFISGLYKICPFIQWWFFYSISLQCLGIFLITFSMFEVSKRKGVNFIYTIIMTGVLYTSLFVNPIANISFSTVPVLLSGGLLSYLLMHILTDEENILVKKNPRLYIMSLIILAISIFHRSESGLSFLPYLLLVWLCYYLRIYKNTKEKYFIQFSVQAFTFILLAVIICISNSVYSSNYNGNEFIDYNVARAEYTDYPHDYYDDNPELYEEAGWSRDLSKNAWYFADTRVTTDSFKFIVSNSKNKNGSQLISNRINQIKGLFERPQDSCWMMVHIILLAVIITLFLKYKSLPFYCTLFWLLLNVGTLFLFLYLLIKGRIISRAVFCITVPLVVGEVIVLLSMLDKVKIKPETILIVFLIVVILIEPILNSVRIDDRYKMYSHIEARDTYDYVINNDDTIFVVYPGEISDQTIGDLYLQKKPINLIATGGSCFHSRYNKECAKLNGLDSEFQTEMLKDSRFHMIFKDIYNSETFIRYYKYMSNDYNAIGFDFKEFGNDLYDIWYIFDDQNYAGNYYTVRRDKIIKIQ